jgi:transcriptional regulator with XRE-family HTH domain
MEHNLVPYSGTLTEMNELKKIREMALLSQGKLGELANSGRSTIAKLERGEIKLTKEWAERLAPHLGCSPVDILYSSGELADATLSPQPQIKMGQIKPVAVIDYVQAGNWRETLGLPHDEQYNVPVFDDRYHPDDLFGVELRGDSMDKEYKAGTVLVCRKFDPTGELPPVGKHVIVRRRSPEGLYETTVKSLETDDHGRGWLVPKSTNSEWEPMEFSNNGDGDGDDVDTEIIGVVVWDVRKHL